MDAHTDTNAHSHPHQDANANFDAARPLGGLARRRGALARAPNGVNAVLDYGNMATPVPLTAHVAGAALFDTGAISGTTTISDSLPTANGAYPLPLIPAIGATAGQTLTVRVDIGPVMLTKDGRISRPIYLPLLLRR